MYVLFLVCLLCVVGTNAQFGQAGAGLPAELSNLDFDSVIGAPLVAVVHAQGQAARTTAEYLDELSFQTVNGEKHAIVVDFVYEQLLNGTLVNRTMHIPFMVMLPVPYLEIKEMKLTFSVKLTSSQTQQIESSTSWYQNTWKPSKWSVGSSGTSSTKQNGQVEREYSMKIHYVARQGEMPRGTEKMLDLFENIIRENVPIP